MPKIFALACITAALSFLVHAAFALFYETGAFKFISPTIFMVNACYFVALLFRKRWAWRWVFAASWAFVLINIVFPPSPEHFGSNILFAQILVGVEVAACSTVFFCMRHHFVKDWFYGSIPS
ncbi:MAG: hypothetical protein WAO71_02650 [Gallionella sp.]